jgi:hypothetical protein
MRSQRRSHTILYFAATIAVISGCGESELGWTGTVTDSAGVQIVANPAEGIWSDADRWTVEEEIRIGSLEGDPNYEFGQIGELAVGSDGSIYVLDVQALQIQVYSSDGKYSRTLAGPGRGPGELGGLFRRSSFSLGLGPGDTLLVRDLMNLRINRYSPDGSSFGSFPVTVDERAFGIRLKWKVTSAGDIVEQIEPPTLRDGSRPDSMDTIILVRASGEVIDTLLQMRSGQTYRGIGINRQFMLFWPDPRWDITDDQQLLFGFNTDYRISVYSPSGSLERVFTKPVDREPVSDSNKEAILSYLEASWQAAGRSGPGLAQRLDNVHFAEGFPAFTSVKAGPNGTVWIQQVQPAANIASWSETARRIPIPHLTESRGAADWDVFDSEGKYLGVVSMPARFAPQVFSENKVYGVLSDDLDVQYVVRLRIVGAD